MHEDRWDPWIEPLLSDPLFQGIETVATEYLLVDRYRSVCGSCDFVIRHKDDPTFVILGDLKTCQQQESGFQPQVTLGPARGLRADVAAVASKRSHH